MRIIKESLPLTVLKNEVVDYFIQEKSIGGLFVYAYLERYGSVSTQELEAVFPDLKKKDILDALDFMIRLKVIEDATLENENVIPMLKK